MREKDGKWTKERIHCLAMMSLYNEATLQHVKKTHYILVRVVSSAVQKGHKCLIDLIITHHSKRSIVHMSINASCIELCTNTLINPEIVANNAKV